MEIHLHKSFPFFWKKRERKRFFSFPQGSKADSAKVSKHRDIRWIQSVYRDRLLLLPKSSQNSKSSILFLSRKGIAKKIFHTNMTDSVIIIKRRRISTFYNALIHHSGQIFNNFVLSLDPLMFKAIKKRLLFLTANMPTSSSIYVLFPLIGFCLCI